MKPPAKSSRAVPSRLLRAVGRVGDALALRGPSHEAFDRIVRSISSEFGYHRVAIFLLRDSGFEKISHVGYDNCQLDPTIGVVARALRSRRPQFVPDVRVDRDYVSADDGVISEICVPLIERSEILGVLNVETVAPLRLNRDDLAFVLAIADRIAAAVVLARDRTDLAHRISILDRLAASSARIAVSLDAAAVRAGVAAAADQLIEDTVVGVELVPIDATGPRDKPAAKARPRAWGPSGDLRRGSLGENRIEVPLLLHETAFGRLSWRRRSNRSFTAAEEQAAHLFGLQATLALANASVHSAVASLAATDALTGLANRRQFDRLIEQRSRVTDARRATMSVLAFDLDHFGLVNKRHSHKTGDAVLQGFASVLRANLRGSDVIARTGGEEFVAILERTAHSNALLVAERIRRSFASWRFLLADGMPLANTVSIGVASSRDDSLEVLLEAADEALRRAKSSGRDRVASAAGSASFRVRASRTALSAAGIASSDRRS
jgi:diguanylate cyclase (GGDEF)-like protein